MVLLRCSSFVLILWILIDTSGSNGDNGTSTCSCQSCPPGTYCDERPPTGCKKGNPSPIATCVNPCAVALCPENTTCIGVDPSTGCSPMGPGSQTPLEAKCTNLCNQKEDPCLNYNCPFGQKCYLNYTLTKSSCTVKPYCRNVCFGVQCPCGQYCYPQKVECVRAPCYAVPKCLKPCDSVSCPKGSKCYIPNVFILCLCPPCSPFVICRANGTTSPTPYTD